MNKTLGRQIGARWDGLSRPWRVCMHSVAAAAPAAVALVAVGPVAAAAVAAVVVAGGSLITLGRRRRRRARWLAFEADFRAYAERRRRSGPRSPRDP